MKGLSIVLVAILNISLLGLLGCQTVKVPIPEVSVITPIDPNKLDSDGDGVHGIIDQCSNTPQHMVVDDKGCTVILNDFTNVLEMEMQVYFPALSRRLSNDYHLEFLKIKEKLIEYPTAQILLFGHASSDEISKAPSNNMLSLDRALMVKYKLVMDYNIPLERVTIYDCLNRLALKETRVGIAYDGMYKTKDSRVTVKVSTEVKDLNTTKSFHLSSDYKIYSQSCELMNKLDK